MIYKLKNNEIVNLTFKIYRHEYTHRDWLKKFYR